MAATEVVIRPPRLRPGARVAVVAPAGPVPADRLAAGLAVLGRRYRPSYDERVLHRHGFLAGDDDARAGALGRALADPDVAAIVCARGGYGVMRILDRLDAAAFRRAPKVIVGFSDIVALHAWARVAGVASVHGPVVTQLGELPGEDAEALFALLESPAPAPPLTGLRALAAGPGVAEGRLVGGNLELLASLWGTRFAVPADGAVLLLEEVGERPYRIDRALTQLRLGGALTGLRGVVLGDFVSCGAPDGHGPDAEAVVRERLADLGVPVLAGAPVGHGQRNRALPLGARVRLDAGAGTLTFLDAAVS